MKKINLLVFLLIVSVNFILNAQPFSPQIISLSAPELEELKTWKSYGGHLNSSGNIVIVLGKAVCDATINKSTQTDYWSGTITEKTVAQFRGVSYTFKELTFDASFKVIDIKELNFATTTEALAYEKSLFGKTFQVVKGDVNTGPGAAITAVAGAFTQGVPELNTIYTGDFLNTIVVAPSQVASVGKAKILVTSNAILSELSGKLYKGGYNASCAERPAYYMVNKKEVSDVKDQVWRNLGNVEYPGGGVIGFITKGLVADNGKANLVFKKYNADLNEVASQQIDLDFFPEMTILRIKNNTGKYDYLVINQAGDKISDPYFKKTPIGKPTEMELIYLDGNTLKPLFREKVNTKFSRWQDFVTLTDEKGATYVLAQTGKDNKTYLNYFNYKKDMVNFGMLKIENGKVSWTSEVDAKGDASMMKVINGEGVKGSVAKEMTIHTPKSDLAYEMQNNRLVIKGQNPQSNLYIAVFDLNSGKLTHYFAKPESIPAEADVFFSKNQNEIYWATYDYKALCEYDGGSGRIYPKKDFPLLGDLYLAKISLTDNQKPVFQKIGDGSFGVFMHGKLLFESTESNQILYYGTSLTKKAKDTQPIMISISK